MPGKLYGIGCGPGDPEQITLQAWKILQRVPVVAVPQGRKNTPGVAAQIIQHHVPGTTRILPLEFAFSHDPATTTRLWERAVQNLLVPLQQGLDVAFVCEGDSSFYSTFTYIAQGLSAHPEIEIQVIPGVCSPCAAAAAVGVPLVQQTERLLVIPAFRGWQEVASALTHAQVIVLLKMAGQYPEIWQGLNTNNLLTSSYVVEWVGWPQQRIYRGLASYPNLQLSYFSLMVIRPQG
ncbi:precorrin-2 methyltransferase [Gloeomargarita lithophora Alchichica-D10]|uniref:Precorrin-2 methyltransferase n=1 Tax=Gloeomargarita lithophora Alchichica-D10 TaxID=1188229 RepID=A0A1J0AFA8_9CYAN|nr:precorrin-2 C(20)-methyltransferase [Gloeomargarita lithophora]APB34591.1 precorrin-2 methyltransferase [Gloeomargarita lithophora Alchichica-D10]